MLNIKYNTEKAALNKDSKTSLLLIDLEGQKKVTNKNVKRQKLNLSLVIDTSGSMSSGIGYRNINQQEGPAFNSKSIFDQIATGRIYNGFGGRVPYSTKIEMAKKAAIKAINELKNGDYVSIVSFNSNVKVLQLATKITDQNKADLIAKISQLQAGGGTDLHSGWVSGVTEVVKNMNEKYVNRVMVLTDGETCSGIVDPTVIAQDVAAIYKTGVTTSTFGVGDTFNEGLLQSMSEQGGGNFYYIKDENEFDQMFSEEFTGMANLAGSEIELKLELNKGFSITDQMNNFVLVDGIYKLANIVAGKNLGVLFKLETSIEKGVSKVNVGEISLTYKDENGNKVEQKVTIEVDVLSQKKWEKLEFVQEVKIQETLLTIAKNKLEATTAIASGNIEGARSILRGASATLSASGFSDDRISASLNTLESTLTNAESMSNQEFSKTMHYQSYKERTGKGF